MVQKRVKYLREMTLIATVDRHLQVNVRNKMCWKEIGECWVPLSLDSQQTESPTKCQQVEIMVQKS